MIDPKRTADYVKSQRKILEHNAQLLDIFEGDLLSYVLADLEKQLSPKTFEAMKHRVTAINILKKVIMKLSTLYKKPPVRTLVGTPSEADKALFGFYDKCFRTNMYMGLANQYFNLFKNTDVEPYLDQGKPQLRCNTSDRFTVRSDDPVTPARPTECIKLMGQTEVESQVVGYKQGMRVYENQWVKKPYMHVYTDEEFQIIDSDGNVLKDMMASLELEGQNPYGKIPSVYINRSLNQLIPTPDSDTLSVVKIFPILISDLSFAIMFQCFSVLYGIDVDAENLVLSPNAFWMFKSDPESGKEPKVGAITPQVQISEVVEFMRTMLGFWLDSKNIKPGSVLMNSTNPISGLSKMVDEMDTSDDRAMQVDYFKTAEKDLWNLVMYHQHPVWSARPEFLGPRVPFSQGLYVDVRFEDQKPDFRPEAVLAMIEREMQLGLESRRGGLMRLRPDASPEEIENKLAEIDSIDRPEPEGNDVS